MELRETFEGTPGLRILWVMAKNQVNPKTLRFIDDLGLRERIIFGVDPGSASIDRLGIRLEDAEPIEAGVPHPTTYLLDAEGRVRFMDARRDYQLWLDSELLARTLQAL